MIEEVMIQAGLSPELFEEVVGLSGESIYKKGALILDKGQVCKSMYIVEEGLLRMFYFDSRGNDISHWFAMEQNLMTSPTSFFERTRSDYLIEALEDCRLRSLSLETIDNLCARHHQFEHFARLLTMQMLKELNSKLMELQFRSARERYLSLIETHPDIFQRVSLSHIASYIGITIQSLSRIRADVSR